MGVLISDLPIELQELAHKRQLDQKNDGKFNGNLLLSTLSGNFNWKNTREGHFFWLNINNGVNVKSSPYYPKIKKIYNYYY